MELLGDKVRTTNSTPPSDLDRFVKISSWFWVYLTAQISDKIEDHVLSYMGPQDMTIHQMEEDMEWN